MSPGEMRTIEQRGNASLGIPRILNQTSCGIDRPSRCYATPIRKTLSAFCSFKASPANSSHYKLTTHSSGGEN
jgi:hypothetical protein